VEPLEIEFRKRFHLDQELVPFVALSTDELAMTVGAIASLAQQLPIAVSIFPCQKICSCCLTSSDAVDNELKYVLKCY